MNRKTTKLIFLTLVLGIFAVSLAAQALTGIKTIGSGGTYSTFTAAINALNSNGVGTGGVIFNVSAGATFAERPPAITATGTEANPIVFQKNGTGANPVITPTGTSYNNEAGIIIAGGDYLTFDGIDINSSAVTNVEFGYLIRNASATDGAQHNTIKNCSITLNRNNTTSIYSSGIVQSSNSSVAGATTATAQSGTNDYNRYLNLTIQNCVSGIIVFGGTYYERNTEISTTDNSIRNTFTNLGTDFGQNCGVYIYKGENGTVHNTDISALSGYNGNLVAAIWLDLYRGEFDVSHNNIKNIQNTATSTSTAAYGFYSTNVNAGTGTLKIFNNTICNINCVSTGNTSELRVAGLRFAFPQSNEMIYLHNNTIAIGYGKTWNFPSAAVINMANSTDITMQGNIVANYAATTGSAKAYAIYASQRHLGDMITDYNLYYSKYSNLGYAGGFEAANLAQWQGYVLYGEDAHSVSGDPYLIDPNSDLHGSGSLAIGIPGFTEPAWVTVDMDYETRGTPTVIGADFYAPYDENSAILAPLTQIPQTGLTSIANTAETALDVFNFRIVDYGQDGHSTIVTAVKVKNALPYNTAVWTTVLQGAVLKVEGIPLASATAVITDNDITFTIPAGDFNVANGQTANLTLAIYFKTTGLVEDKTLKFKISASDHGFTTAFWGSRLLQTLAADISSETHYINVIATQFQLIYPARDLVNRQFDVVARAVDANGILDYNYTSTSINMILHTGTGIANIVFMGGFTEGDALWHVTHNKIEHIKLQITTTDLSGITGFIEINPYIEISSEPVVGYPMDSGIPFVYDYRYGRDVALYTNAEVNGYYSIEAISWNVVTPTNSNTPLPIKIYMKPYTNTFFGIASSTWETMISGATLVFNGTVTATTAGWKKINLDTVYNNSTNTQNLLVMVESNWSGGGYPSAANCAGSYLYSQDYAFYAAGYTTPTSPLTIQKHNYRPYVRLWVTSNGYYEDAITEQSSTASISANSTNQQIIRVNVMTSGTLSQLTVNSFTFNTTGTTDVSDITAAKVFYTGSSTTFSTSTQYGSTVTNLGSKGIFTVSQNLNVSAGNNYFWLVYDVGANLNVGDRFDAQCTSVRVANIDRTPSITDPAGYRSVAGKKLMSVSVAQLGQGTTSSGAQNLGILLVEFNVGEGSDSQSFASLKLNSMNVTGKNTNNADVTAVKLANQSSPSSFLGTASIATGTASFSSLNYDLPLGPTYLYIFYDLSSNAGAGNVVDAKILANAINVSGFTYPATTQDPSGEYTIQNYNYGGGYAQQGGYYFANTLATPAPSYPTFNWIDISATGTNAYPDLTNDDGAAPNNDSGYPIGFNFPYYGSTFSTFWIGADGMIYFTKPTLPLPMYTPPSNAISLFNFDFMPATADYPKTILYKNVDGKLVVTYLKVQPKNGSNAGSFATFQVVLFPTGKFKIQFLEFGPTFPTNNGTVFIVNSNASAFHMYAYGGQAGPVTGASPIAVAYGQNAYMLGDTPAQNDLPVSVSGTGTANFPITGATVQFTTATAATNLTAIRVDTNPLGTLPVGILSLANRHWTINSTATNGLGSYNLTLNLNGLPNVGGANLFYLVKRSHVSSAWENIGLPVSFDNNTKLATWAISNGFSDFGIGFEEDFTLPVELSSFTATLTAQNFVKLSWTSQSETGLHGYYVYRAMSSQLNSAQLVSPLISATNTSSQHHYEFTDQEIYDEGTYYYWLQSNELDGSNQFFGPVTVFYTNQTEIPLPEIPMVTALNNIYPNPFNPLAHIGYTLKESVPVELKIYNKRGQLVRSFANPPNQVGLHRLLWDGKDNNGKSCSSGVYLFRMTAGNEVFTQKAILLK